jgi:hypothetical protein
LLGRIDLNVSAAGCDQRQALWSGVGILGIVFMDSVGPDDSNPIPLRRSQQTMASIMIRFVGLLLVAVVVMVLIWSR